MEEREVKYAFKCKTEDWVGIVAVSLWEWEICTRPRRQKKCGGGSVFLFFLSFDFILGRRIQSWHMQLVSHLVCTMLTCEAACENQIDVSRCRSHRRPLRRRSSELLA